MTAQVWEPLPREEVKKAVERERPCRIPLIRAKWWGEGLAEQYGDRLQEFDRFPEDCVQLWVDPFCFDRMGLSWEIKSDGALDSNVVIDKWERLEEFVAKLIPPEENQAFKELPEQAEAARKQDRYIFFGWWRLFFERPWGLRGMQNLMLDYHTAPDMVHKLHNALCEHYCRYIEYGAEVLDPDAFWTSDDLGHQTGPMMNPAVFHELIYPYYCRVGRTVEQAGQHFWLHSCGDNTLLLDDLIDAGVDVFHPVQKHTMDEKTVAEEFGDDLSFLAGIDVQHILQEKGPAGVREEVRFLIDTFDRPEGGMCIAAGNGIVSGTPFENIEAFLDEALQYGAAHRGSF